MSGLSGRIAAHVDRPGPAQAAAATEAAPCLQVGGEHTGRPGWQPAQRHDFERSTPGDVQALGDLVGREELERAHCCHASSGSQSTTFAGVGGR